MFVAGGEPVETFGSTRESSSSSLLQVLILRSRRFFLATLENSVYIFRADRR